MKDDVGQHGCSTSSVNNTAKRVLRVLSTCSLLELANSHGDSSPIPAPEALGQSRMLSWHWWLQTMVLFGCCLVGFAFLVAAGAIRFRVGNFRREIPREPAVDQVAVLDEVDGANNVGETASERLYRYKNDSLSECSDPDYWMELNHFQDSSSESDEPPYERFASNFIQAIDGSRSEVGNFAICEYLMARCNRRLQAAGDEEPRRFYSNAVNALNNRVQRFGSGELSDSSGDLRNILREFARMSPHSDSPTSSLTVQQISDKLRRYMNRNKLHWTTWRLEKKEKTWM